MTLTCFYRGCPLWTWEHTAWPPAEVFAGRWGPEWSYLIVATVEESAEPHETGPLMR